MTNKAWSVGMLALLLALVGVGQAEAGLVTAVNSSLALTAEALCDYSPLVTDTDAQSQGSATNPLNVAVQAVSTYGPASLAVSGSASATWATPSQGQVLFTGIGWTSTQANGLADLSSNTGWTYSFISNVNGSFVIDYSVTAQGTSSVGPPTLFGLNDGFLVYGGQGLVPTPGTPWNLSTGLNTTGTFSLAIAEGIAYTFEIQDYANLQMGIGTRNVHMDGTFDFQVQAVPEPSSLLMAATTFPLCLGYWGHRRHRSAP